MGDLQIREDLVRRLAAALRAGELYNIAHPLVQRSVEALSGAATTNLQGVQTAVVAFLGNDIIVNEARIGKFSASLVGFVRDMREREIEKITFHQGLTRDDLKGFVEVLADRKSQVALADRLAARGVRRVVIGKIQLEGDDAQHSGIAVARKVYTTAVETAETLWDQAKAGDK